MSSVSVIIATYGDVEWAHMAEARAYPSLEQQDDPDFTFVTRHEEHGTRATSLNNAAAEADSDWLIFLDADDELGVGYVSAMRKALESHEARRGLERPGGVRCGGARHDKVLFTPSVQQIRKGRPGAPFFYDKGRRTPPDLRKDNWLVIGTMIHRDLFNEVGGFDEYPHGFEDWALWSKCYRIGAKVVKVPDAVYRQFWNPHSAHKTLWKNRRLQVETHLRVEAELDAWEAAR